MAISKKTRFKIFERDNFTCQYCGKKPPECVLEADHMVSKKDGGGDEEMNLITSCFACNRGKSAKSVDIEKKKKVSFKKELEALEEKKVQLEAYYDFLKKKSKAKKDELQVFQKAWEEASKNNSLTDIGLTKIKKLLRTYTAEEIFEAIEITWEKSWDDDNNGQFRYMCGVLKNKKLAEENPKEAERRKKAYSLRLFISNKLGYINDGVFWKWVNDGMLMDNIEEATEASENWTELKEYIFNEYYE